MQFRSKNMIHEHTYTHKSQTLVASRDYALHIFHWASECLFIFFSSMFASTNYTLQPRVNRSYRERYKSCWLNSKQWPISSWLSAYSILCVWRNTKYSIVDCVVLLLFSGNRKFNVQRDVYFDLTWIAWLFVVLAMANNIKKKKEKRKVENERLFCR